jgi:hypothetical protein
MGNIIKDGSGSYFQCCLFCHLPDWLNLHHCTLFRALLPKLSEVYHIPLNQVGMILSAEVGFLAFAMLFSGSLSDRFGRKPVIFASLFAGGVLTLLCALAPSWQVLVIFRALLGIAVSGVTAVRVYISEGLSGYGRDHHQLFYLWQFSGKYVREGYCDPDDGAFSVEVIFSLLVVS